jgi:hypothetical protein
MDEQNTKYGNEDIVDCLDVLDFIEVCEKRISRHKLLLCQTTTSTTIPGNENHSLHTYITKSHTSVTYDNIFTLTTSNLVVYTALAPYFLHIHELIMFAYSIPISAPIFHNKYYSNIILHFQNH